MSSGTFTAACIQLSVGDDPDSNIKITTGLIRDAYQRSGAAFFVTPECTNMIQPDRAKLRSIVQTEEQCQNLQSLRRLAAELGVWICIGSLLLKIEGQDKLVNRQFLINANGEIVNRYDKIHMFDVDLPDGQTYKESATYEAGTKPKSSTLPWGKLGHGICYDMRFPELYLGLAKDGADFLLAPSAFTRFTGKAHWHVLLRARAIETGCFVFAAAQCGEHAGGRETYGHSLIVAPWGEILADGGEPVGWVSAEIDRTQVVAARNRVPSLSNQKTLLF
jgi:predicted amidohydrolase